MEKNQLFKRIKNRVFKPAAVVSVFGSIFMSLGWFFFDMMVCCRKNRKKERKKWFELSHMKINHPRYKFSEEYEAGKAWCREQDMQDCYIRSRDGLLLHASYLPAEDPQRSVLLSHGYRGSGFGDFAGIAGFLHENHCNLLFIDQRCCGKSEGNFITFGAKEQYDVQKWAFFLNEKEGGRLPIYLYGESMGASAVLMASAHRLPHTVKGLISDCGFCSMKKQLKDMAVNWFHLDHIELLLFRVNLFCRLLAGFSMKDADTAHAMQNGSKPVLFFHGLKDTYVDPQNSRHHYKMCRAPKELILVPEARHLCSVYEAPALYRKKLLEFFGKYD